MVRIDEHCFSVSMTLCKFMCKNYIIDLWDVFFFCGTKTTTLYQLVRIDWKGWLVYIVLVCRKDTVRDIRLQRKYCRGCLENKKEKHQRHREKDLNMLKTIMKSRRNTEKNVRKAYSQTEIACEVCKSTLRKCGWTKHVLMIVNVETKETFWNW